MSRHSGAPGPESDLSQKFRPLVEIGLAWTAERDVSALLGRILHEARRFRAMADVFDALSSTRCHKTALSTKEACVYLRKETGRHFSPLVVQAFFQAIDKITKIRGGLSS